MASSSRASNSCPMTAAVCAVSRAGPRRSRRSASRSRSVVGKTCSSCSSRDGSSNAPPSAVSASATEFASSSTNSGLPSARSSSCSMNPAGRFFAAGISAARLAASRCPRRVSVSRVTFGWRIQPHSNSGRAVTSSINRRRPMRSTQRVSSSADVGSIQCASSSTSRAGPFRSARRTCASIRFKVFALKACGVRSVRCPFGRLGNASSAANSATLVSVSSPSRASQA